MDVNTLKKIIKGIIWLIFGVGIVCVMIGMDDDDALIIGCSALGVAVMLWINYALSTYFYHVATEKGYYEACYLWIPFVFSMIGYILVAALPDRGNREKPAPKPVKKYDPHAEIAKYKQLLDSGIITQEEFDKIEKRILES